MQIYKQTMNRTKHTWTMTDLFWIGMNLMLDFGISFFKLRNVFWFLFMFPCSYCLCQVLINLTFNLDISLFMLNICNTIIRYYDCSQVSIEFLCFHTCMSLVSLLSIRSNTLIRSPSVMYQRIGPIFEAPPMYRAASQVWAWKMRDILLLSDST